MANIVPGTTNALDAADIINSKTTTFNNVEAMQLAEGLEAGDNARTLGYYEPGDGGGNDYEIVAAGTGTDDGGSFINLDGSGLQAKGLFNSGRAALEQFGPIANAESGASIQNWFDFLDVSGLEGYQGAREYRFSNTVTLSGSSVKIDSHPTATLRYMGDFDGLIITGRLHKLIFGIITIDISKSPSTRSTVCYYELGRSNIYIHRLGANSGNGIKYDGLVASSGSGDNTWHIHNGETGNTEYAVNLIAGPEALEGERWTANSFYSSTECTLKVGSPGGSKTIRYNDYDIALFGARSGSKFSQNLMQLNSNHNTVRMGVWTQSLGPEIYCAPDTRNNLIEVTPGLQYTTEGFDKKIRVDDNGANYVRDYRPFGGRLGDDQAVSFTPDRQSGLIEVYAERTGYCLLAYDMVNPIISIVVESGGTWGAVTTPLTGTTGADGAITVGIDATNNLVYIENRSGILRRTAVQTRMHI